MMAQILRLVPLLLLVLMLSAPGRSPLAPVNGAILPPVTAFAPTPEPQHPQPLPPLLAALAAPPLRPLAPHKARRRTPARHRAAPGPRPMRRRAQPRAPPHPVPQTRDPIITLARTSCSDIRLSRSS